jgi:hypothetical protein
VENTTFYQDDDVSPSDFAVPSSPPPPHTRPHPPHHCAYAPRPVVTARLSRTPPIDGGQCARWQPRQHKVASNSAARTYVPSSYCQAPVCATQQTQMEKTSPCASRARLINFWRTVDVLFAHTARSPTLTVDGAQCAYDDGEVAVACAGDLARLRRDLRDLRDFDKK